MGTIANPLSGLIDGLLKGHELASQLHRQQLEDQAFKTNQALHEQNMSVQDIMNRQMLQEHARPVSDMGTVDSPAVDAPSPLEQIPGMPAAPGNPALPAYHRKADASRTVKYGGKSYELKTPEEQQQAAIDRQVKGQDALEIAKGEGQQRVRESVLKMRGVPVPEELAADLKMSPGTLVLPEEIPGLAEHVRAMHKPENVAPGGSLVDPVTGKVVANGGVAPATGEFGSYLRASLMKAGYTEQNAPPDLVMKATSEYAQKSKDPAMQELAKQMAQTNLHLAQTRLEEAQAKRSTTPTPIEAGTREYKLAQDLAYGRLTMAQFRSMYAYSRDTNKKLDIYDKAGELNPNFNPAQFEMGFSLAKNPKVQQQLASMDNVKKGVDDLLKFSDAASRSGATVLNKFVIPGGIALGGKKYSDFHAAQIGFADELSGALGFGGATDMSRQMGVDMTNPNLSPENFRSAVENVVVPFIERKRKTLLDQMGVYGMPGMNPAAGPASPPAASKPPLSAFEKK